MYTQKRKLNQSSERISVVPNVERFFELSLDFLCILGFDGYLKQINPTWEKTLGFSTEELLAVPFIEFVHPEDRAATLAEVQQLATGIKKISFETRQRCKDSSYRWISWMAIPSLEENSIYAVGRDMTELQQSSEALRDREKRYELVTRATNDAIWDWNLMTNEVEWNEGVQTLFGYSAEDVETSATWWYEHIHPEDRERIVSSIHEVIDRSGQIWCDEYRYRRADNSYALVVDRGFIAHDDRGNPVRMLGSMMDITKYTQMQHALKKANEALELQVEERTAQLRQTVEQLEREIGERKTIEATLHEEREFLKTLLDNLTDGIVACDANGILTQFNRATREYCGLPEYPIPPDRWADFYNLYFPDGKTRMQMEEIPLFRALQGEIIQNMEVVFAPKKGKQRTLLVSGQAIVDTSGNKLGAVIALRDITDRKEAEAALQESQSRLNSILNCLKDVVWSVDVNTFEVLFLNPATEKLYGRSVKEFFENSNLWLEVIHPDDRDRALDNNHYVIKNGSGEIEYRILQPNGTVRWIHVRSWLVYDVTGKGIRMDGTISDITDRKDAEKTRERLTAILEATTDFVGIADATGRALYVNKAGRQMVGIGEHADVTTLFIPDFLPEWMSERMNREIMPIAIDEGVWCGEMSLRHQQDNREIPGSQAFMSHKSEHGEVEFFSTIIRDISDRFAIEEALRNSTRQLTEAQKVAHVGSWEFDLATQVVTWSEELLRIYNMESRETTPSAEEFLQLVHPDDREVVAKAIERAIAEGKPYEIDHRMLLFDGSIKYLSSKGQPIFDAEGKVIKLFGTGLDISDRKRTEEALRCSEQLYRALARNFPKGGVFLFDRDLRYTLADGTELAAIGQSKELMEGRTIWETWTPEISQYIEPMFRDALAGKTTVCEIPYDGKVYLMQTLPITDPQAEIFAGMAVVQNITDRKQAEEALQRSETEFRQLAAREALINRLAGEIRHSLDVDTILETVVQEIRNLLQIDRCLFVCYRSSTEQALWDVVKEAKTPALPAMLGCYPAAGNSLDRKVLNMEMLRAEDLSRTTDLALRELHTDLGYTALLSLPLQMPSGDIGLVSCINHEQPRNWSDSEVELLKGVGDQLAIALSQAELYRQAQDSATQAREQAQQLEQTLHELRFTQAQLIQTEKMSSLGQMVAGVAHEINNPVNFIHGNLVHLDDYTYDLFTLVRQYQESYPNPDFEVQALLDEIDLDFLAEDLPKLLSSMQMGTKRIREIVLSLRNFSRLDEAEMKEVDLHEGIDNTLLILQNRLKVKLENADIEIVKEYGNLPLVECYAGQMNQVFMNLLNNAIDALEAQSAGGKENRKEKYLSAIAEQSAIPNSQSPTIRIRTEITPFNSAIVRIADNGSGMTEEVKSRLFDPFFTTKPVGKGTGLGLSISYQIVVDKHGGTLKCMSEPGKGSEFIIEIPISQFPGNL